MGNKYRFKLSELIPNAWFYKLKDMGKKSRQKQETQQNSTVSPSPINRHHSVPTTTARSPRPPPPPPPRRSSHHSRQPQNQKSRLRHHRPTTLVDTNPQLDFSTTSGDSTATGTGSFSPEFRSDQVLLPEESLESSWQSPNTCVSSNLSKASTFTPPQPRRLHLRPINTKPTTVRKTAVSSPATGVRLRLRSPRISTRKSVSSSTRRSRAVVKASVDPRRDFKESMEEMIAENNLTTSKDLEELLACYLCLNSDQYHNIIINVFKQIWIDLNLNLPPHHVN